MFVFPIIFLFVIIYVSRNGRFSIQNDPRLIVEAVLVGKRVGPNNESHYLTFQFESGDRLELKTSGREYGMLVPGDYGKLTFQGRRYINFDRSAFIPDNDRF